MPVMSVIIMSDNVLNDNNHCIIKLPHYSFYLGFSLIQFIIHLFPMILSLIIVHFGIRCRQFSSFGELIQFQLNKTYRVSFDTVNLISIFSKSKANYRHDI